MSLIDVSIPLVGGILLVACPHIFVGRTSSEQDRAKRTGRLRKIGYGLLGVAALYFVIALARPH